MKSVTHHVYIGSFLVIGIIFLFLRDWRATFIVCLSIPISVVGTFALLYFAGFTLNTMTFGGLALGVGMIVDASIVVLENAFRHMEKGKSRMVAAIEGSEEVWSAILASILTHIAVFVPLLFLTGVSSVMFVQLAVVVMFSLLMSLFVAVTIVPVLCSRLLRLPPPEAERRGITGRLYTWSEHVLEGLDDGYRALIHKALQHRPTVIGASAAITLVAFLLLPTIPSELMPQTDEGEVSVSARFAPGTRFERVEAIATQLEEMVRNNVPEAVTIMSNAGGGGGFGGPGGGGGGGSNAQVTVQLTPATERERTSDQIATDLRRVLVGLPGVQITTRVSGGNQQMTRLMGGGGDSRLAVEVRGDDLEQAKRISQDVLATMRDVPGVANPQLGREEGRPELAIRVDRPKAALLGLSVSGVANTIRTNISGTQAATFREHGKEFPIIVRLREEDRERSESVNDVLISTPQGQVLPARTVLDLNPQSGPTQIERKNQQRVTRVNAELDADATMSGVIKGVQDKLPELDIPQGFSVGFGAEVEQQAQAFQQLQVLLVLGVLLVYAVMASQYESLRDPFIVMFSVPVAAIGVVLALLVDVNVLQPPGVYRSDHACGDRRQQRHPARGLHERASAPRPPAAS